MDIEVFQVTNPYDENLKWRWVLVETCFKSSYWEVLYKNTFFFLPGLHVMEIGWTVLGKGVIPTRVFIFPQVVLWQIRTGSSSQESRFLGVRNKVIASFLPKIFSHSVEYLDYLSVSSWKIRKKAIRSKQAKRKSKQHSISGKEEYFQQNT